VKSEQARILTRWLVYVFYKVNNHTFQHIIYSILFIDQYIPVNMSDSGPSSSSTSSNRLNSSTSTIKKRTLSDAGLDDAAEGDNQNNGKRVVVFEAFKLFDVQSAVSSLILFSIFIFFLFSGRT
jgi:hypothetical protein